MIVAGLGFRGAATLLSLEAALAASGAAGRLDALASLADKAQHPALTGLAHKLGVPILPIPRAALAGLATLTRSCRIEQAFGTGSVAEACALAASGPGARLIALRATSKDCLATCAIAQGVSP